MTYGHLLAAGILALSTLPSAAADWSDTSLGYRTGSKFQEPSNPNTISKNIFSLSHASGYSLGSNFFSVDMLTSESTDPANTAGSFNGAGSKGAHEVYVVYRTTLSFDKVFSTKIDFGPVRGIDLTAGFDYAAKNTTFAPAVYKLLVGPTFRFKVPGFFNVGVLYYKEKNHNAYGASKVPQGGGLNVSFDATYQVAAAWGIPVALGPINTSVKGFATYTGSKGKDGSAVDTKPEVLIRAFYMFDASPLLGTKKGTWQIGPGYEFWDNKFGDPTFSTSAEAAASGTGGGVNPRTNCVMVALEVHF